MVVTTQLKQKIVDVICSDFAHKQRLDDAYTQKRYAAYLGIDSGRMSRMLGGEIEMVLSPENWVRIATKLNIDLSGQDWKTAQTSVYKTISLQLEYCQEHGVSRLFADLIGVGKTHTALEYVKRTVNVAYVNCKKYQTRQTFMRELAKAFGFDHTGRFIDVRENLINQIRTLNKPLIIIDDMGYLKDEAILEVIALWDELVYSCGIYQIGEPSLIKRLSRMMTKHKLGWEAWFSRNAERILSVMGDISATGEMTTDSGEIALMKRTQAKQILELNYPGLNKKERNELLNESSSNLRTLREDIRKHKTQAHEPA